MNRNDKLFLALLIAFIVIVTASLCIVYRHQQAQAEQEQEQQQRAEQVENAKSDAQNVIFEEAQREATNRQIKAERAEAERLEAERIAEEERLAKEAEEQAYQAWLASQYTAPATTSTTYTEPTGRLTKSGGVNYYNGSRETWYSSNQLYHYRTGEWTCGADGVYRDSDGYVVVARSDMAQGATLETSLGTGKVYDSGCANGTTDIYTAW